MDEFSFIASLRQPFYKQSSLIKGIGDDAAVLRNPSEDLVISVDTFAEGIHFTRQTMSLEDIGYKALAANISDLAAMGARPAFYLLSLAIPKEWEMEDVQRIIMGMREIGDTFNMDLIGGDTVSSGSLVLSVTVMGYVDQDRASYRSTAEEGDVVFVTGTLGDSAKGLQLLLQPEQELEHRTYFESRHQRPSPRAKFAYEVAKHTRVTLNDISDGIASEANEIAESSSIDLHIQYEQLPVHEALSEDDEKDKWILSGGEDFELIGTVARKDWPIVHKVASQTNVQVTEIGKVVPKSGEIGQAWLRKEGLMSRLNKSGYNHFK
ncbi:thiamine-phosphate kinase [Aciduricibacillus chroicocephali]|uniref:Thiamine-monophosphate kinase n=1 Tax=Aciduricibacillus chroicocephali TaxID=3054939 RepID=A0ABY9KZS5_9BACI|nr:thiamine-phosphate kinase [Bacillaceae bacterium 44XB]